MSCHVIVTYLWFLLDTKSQILLIPFWYVLYIHNWNLAIPSVHSYENREVIIFPDSSSWYLWVLVSQEADSQTRILVQVVNMGGTHKEIYWIRQGSKSALKRLYLQVMNRLKSLGNSGGQRFLQHYVPHTLHTHRTYTH